jgi:hypothetical protein
VGERGGVSEPSKRNQFRSTNKSLKHVWTKVKSKRSEGEGSPMHLDLQKQNRVEGIHFQLERPILPLSCVCECVLESNHLAEEKEKFYFIIGIGHNSK